MRFPPNHWLHAFDLVVEIITVQALPDPPRRQAIVNVGRLVAPGGALLAIAAAHCEAADAGSGPPWPLRRAEIDAFATDGLTPASVELISDGDTTHWRACFHRQPAAVFFAASSTGHSIVREVHRRVQGPPGGAGRAALGVSSRSAPC